MSTYYVPKPCRPSLALLQVCPRAQWCQHGSLGLPQIHRIRICFNLLFKSACVADSKAHCSLRNVSLVLVTCLVPMTTL